MSAAPDTPLVFVLRNDLGLSGAKLGCGAEHCGACLVLVDGQPAYSCTRTVGDLEGARIETVEALRESTGALHPLQQAFLDFNAAQCGFCTSGMLVRARALLESKPRPTREDVITALDPQLCRCGAHPRIVQAVLSAAERMRGAL